jgi:hypothetical protein
VSKRECRNCGADITGAHFNRRFCGDKCKKADLLKRNPDYFYNYSLNRYYGMDRDTYNAMGELQGWLCCICGDPPSADGNGGKLVVDHCHKTGKVRALLCSMCNKGIGMLRDDADLADKASKYLREYAA